MNTAQQTRRWSLGLLALLGALSVMCEVASAQGIVQGISEPPPNARLQWGPLTLAPTVSVTSGVDTNVLNEEENPTRDFVTRFTPATQAWLKLGRSQLQFRGGLTAAHFSKTEEQRSVNVTTDARFDLDLFRVVPYVSAGFVRTRDRAGFEIDTRPLRTEYNATGGVLGRLTSKTSLVAGAYRTWTAFDEQETFEDTSLQEALNRTQEGVTGSLRYAVTPITTIAVIAEARKDRFEFSPLRNADSLRVAPSVEFSPVGLITGGATVGYRRFTPEDASVPPFTGVVAAVDLNYVLRGTTRFGVRTERDVAYSFEPTEPYYLLTAWQASVTQSIVDRVQVMGSYGRQRLNYQALGATTTDGSRVDRGTIIGSSVMFLTSRNASFGVTIDYGRRASGVVTREYDGFRFGVVINYGL